MPGQNGDHPVQLEFFRPQFAERVRTFILGIQVGEFKVPITAEDQPDLFDIPGVYQRGAGQFWLARQGDQVVGTLALHDLGEGRCALRKMFVAQNFRGPHHNIAQQLLGLLLKHAHQRGVADISLGTTEVMPAAHRFYEKNGFVRIEREALPSQWPHNRVDVRFYRRVLTPRATSSHPTPAQR